MKNRLIGALLLALGLGLGYISVLSPIQAAKNHDIKVSLYLKGAIAFPVVAGLGLIFLILGDHTDNVIGNRSERKPLGYVIVFALAGVGVLIYFGVKGKLESLGYSFGSGF